MTPSIFDITFEGHPENYRRLESTWDLLQKDGILEHLVQVESQPASVDALLRVHTKPTLIASVKYRIGAAVNSILIRM